MAKFKTTPNMTVRLNKNHVNPRNQKFIKFDENGLFETDNERLIARLRVHSDKFEEVMEEEVEEIEVEIEVFEEKEIENEEIENIDYSKMDYKELRKLAIEKGLDNKNPKKTEILKFLEGVK